MGPGCWRPSGSVTVNLPERIPGHRVKKEQPKSFQTHLQWLRAPERSGHRPCQWWRWSWAEVWACPRPSLSPRPSWSRGRREEMSPTRRELCCSPVGSGQRCEPGEPSCRCCFLHLFHPFYRTKINRNTWLSRVRILMLFWRAWRHRRVLTVIRTFPSCGLLRNTPQQNTSVFKRSSVGRLAWVIMIFYVLV